MAEHISSLRFSGQISSGVGKHKEMVIPGRSTIANAPEDWPEELCPGSLNIFIDTYPEGFSEPVGRSRGTYQLDDESFLAEFVITGDRIANNKLIIWNAPAAAQVWRARLHLFERTETIECWVLRRFGSNVGNGMGGNVLEIVSAEHLRHKHNLRDNERVTLELIKGKTVK